MAMTILSCLIFAVLGSIVEPTMSFTSNIHEIMTPAQRLAVFGSEDSIPEYQVFPMSIPGARRRREAGGDINLNLELNGKEIKLDLKPTTGYLATKYTPVWSAISDKSSYKGIRYDPLPTAMSDVGDFTMYHDTENEAAITAFADQNGETIIEGIITSDFAIRSLPKGLIEGTLKVGDYVVETPMLEKRSISSDAEEEMTQGYFAAFKVPAKLKDVKRTIMDPEHHLREKRARGRGGSRKIPEAVYPEILIILDHNAIRDHTITQAMRFMLAFWNGVDLVYSALNEPKVHMNMAGIIIAADDTATPYIAPTTTVTIMDVSRVLEGIGTYFYHEQVRFPLEQYDMIIAMTPIKMCFSPIEDCEGVLGVAKLRAACKDERRYSRSKSIRSTGIFYYNWKYGGVDTAVHEAAHLFGVSHDEGWGRTAECDMKEGHVMAASAQYAHQSFKWSQCSRNFFSHYFASKESACLDNEPLWTKPVSEVLPGRWLTMDGQCRNDGFEKACKLDRVPICMAKGCQAEGSTECVPNQWVPLPGSPCGTNKYCNNKQSCLNE